MWSVLENMSGQGSTVGGRLSELRSIIDQVRDQTRVGVCLDTCHAFAAGASILTSSLGSQDAQISQLLLKSLPLVAFYETVLE